MNTDIELAITINDIFAEDGPIKSLKDNYSVRESQVEGANLVSDALAGPTNMLLEGPCGYGKTLTYLLPILHDMVENDGGLSKKALIVTSGISLQEQLMYKDIPFAIKVIEEIYPAFKGEIRFALLKGRQNFLCNKKVDTLGITGMSDAMLDYELKKIKKFAKCTKTGDFSELDFIPKAETTKSLACTDKGECIGRKCEFEQECYYNISKIKLRRANIIVTNYHMLFSDLESGGKILPKYETLVLDEAHETANIFRDFGQKSVSLGVVTAIRNKASQARNENPLVENNMNIEPFQGLITDFEILSARLKYDFKKLDSPLIITSFNELPRESLIDFRGAINKADKEVCDALSMFEFVDEDSSDEMIKSKTTLTILNTMINELSEFVGGLNAIIKNPNNAVWLEAVNDNVSINVKMVDAGEELYNKLLNEENLTTILTSATMTVAKSFDYIKSQVGIDFSNKPVIEYIGKSPFDLTNQQLWYLPKESLNGNDRDFSSRVPNQIMELIIETGGGMLCLFTSIKAMKYVSDVIKRQFGSQYEIYVQGDAPRTKLIEKFKENKDSILFGTKALFTGIDIPGDSLRCLVIDKFPFPQPTDPVQQKLMERDNAFFKFSIPEMVISLKQAVGRGVRSVDDKCVITILDGRISTARYKARVNNSFDYKKTGTRNLEDIGQFLGKEYDPSDEPF